MHGKYKSTSGKIDVEPGVARHFLGGYGRARPYGARVGTEWGRAQGWPRTSEVSSKKWDLTLARTWTRYISRLLVRM